MDTEFFSEHSCCCGLDVNLQNSRDLSDVKFIIQFLSSLRLASCQKLARSGNRLRMALIYLHIEMA